MQEGKRGYWRSGCIARLHRRWIAVALLHLQGAVMHPDRFLLAYEASLGDEDYG